MRAVSHISILSFLVTLCACGGSTEPGRRDIPLPHGSYSFDGANALTNCVVITSAGCGDSTWAWIGHAQGTMTFGDTVPGTLQWQTTTGGVVDVSITGSSLTGAYYANMGARSGCDGKDWSCWQSLGTSPMSLGAPSVAHISFDGNSIDEIVFLIPITSTAISYPGTSAQLGFSLGRVGSVFKMLQAGVTSTLSQ